MSPKERLLLALDGEKVDRAPCACPLQTGTVDLMEACGAYWPEANHSSSCMSRLARAAHDFAGIESVRVPFDITVDASAFGAGIGYDAIDRQPAILDTVLTDPEVFDLVSIPDPLKAGRAPIILDAVRELSSDKEIPVICAIVAPFMLTAQLRGGQVTLMDVVLRPDLVKEVLEKAMEWDIAYATAALDAGADVITLIDATASGDILSPSQFAEFALPYQKMVTDAVRKEGGRSILHICGDTYQNIPLMLQSRANGISIDQCMDLAWVKEQAKGSVAIIGNVNPITTLLFGTPDLVQKEAIDCLYDGCDVLAPGCGFAPRTPLNNMRALVSASISNQGAGPYDLRSTP
jgi:[methyl-Co(III) methylamine-specific corrinoid protein]:coenzyme M methyltransferase